MGKYIMALDAGTTSNRCILFNEKGERLSVAQREFTQYFPKPGWVEHDANEIWSTMLGVAVEAMAESGRVLRGISRQSASQTRERRRSSGTRTPASPSITQSSGSAAARRSWWTGYGPTAWRSISAPPLAWFPDAYFSATKIKWVLDHVEGAREKAAGGRFVFGTVDAAGCGAHWRGRPRHRRHQRLPHHAL